MPDIVRTCGCCRHVLVREPSRGTSTHVRGSGEGWVCWVCPSCDVPEGFYGTVEGIL